MGYFVETGPDVKREADTFTCGHCQYVVFLRPNGPIKVAPDLGGYCRTCMQLICGPCTDKGTCTPWEKQMEKAEARQRMLDSILGRT